MDDEKMIEFLKTFRPKKAPPEMDERVLAAAEKAARGRTASRGRRVAVCLAAAAAVVLVALVLMFSPRPAAVQTPPDTGKAAAAVVRAVPSGEEVAARASLLEAKLSRLRQLARLSENRTRHLSDLDALKKELEAITSRITDTKTPEKKPNGESYAPEKNGGERHVEESNGRLHRVCAGIRTGRARRG